MLASEEGHYSVELVDNTGILHSCCVCVCVCVCARARACARPETVAVVSEHAKYEHVCFTGGKCVYC